MAATQDGSTTSGTTDGAAIVIVGAGFAGICMGIKLREAGFRDFVILEKAGSIGGTWRDNTYPGCACDVQSHMYSFSFEPNPTWTRMFSPQPEIRRYLRHCVDTYQLAEHLRFGVRVAGAHFDDATKRWRVETGDGGEIVCRALVLGMGPLHIPNVPDIPGLQRFQGTRFHSSGWDHDFDPAGKRIAVIGTGASAVQFIPEIAPAAAHLEVFMRTPPWIMPKPDRPISGTERRLFRALPAAQRAYRNLIYWTREGMALGFNNPRIMEYGQRTALRHLRRQVGDPRLRAELTPDYTMGCKRVLISDDFYPALQRDNTGVCTEKVIEVDEHAVVTADGERHEVDAIIFGTGFHVTDAFDAVHLTGRRGLRIQDAWTEGMRAFLGITVTDFPNMFLLVGPNTGLGHTSIIFMIEAQVHYIMQCLRLLGRRHADLLDVRAAALEGFSRRVGQRLDGTVWNSGGCKSWYLDANGRNTTVWPGYTWQYWLRTRSVDPLDYRIE